MRGEIDSKCFPANQWALQGAGILVAALSLTGAGSAAQRDASAIPQRGSRPGLNADRRIVVSIPDRKLALLEDGQVVKVYRIAVGAPNSPSPSGHFMIVHRVANPTYYTPGAVVPPSVENPLGTRWIGLDLPHFGIHGTNQPLSIGRRASHGCVRMRNRDAEHLFERVRVGDPVELIAERTEETAQIFGGPRPAVISSPATPQTQQSLEVASGFGDQK